MGRNKTLAGKMGEAAEYLAALVVADGTARAAQASEEIALRERAERLRDEVAFVTRREREAQEEFRRLRDELAAL